MNIHHLYNSIHTLWPDLPAKSVSFVCAVCIKHSLDPISDIAVVPNKINNRRYLILRLEKLKKHLEDTGELIVHKEIRDDTRGSVRAGITLRENHARLTVEVHRDRSSMTYDELSCRVWTLLLFKRFCPLLVDLDNCVVVAEPEIFKKDYRSRANLPWQTKTRKFIELEAEAEKRLWSLCFPTPYMRHERDLNACQYLCGFESGTESDLLAEVMSYCGFLSHHCDVPWAIESLLAALFESMDVEFVRPVSAFALRIAATVLLHIKRFVGPSPVTAIGDSVPLRAYLKKGLALLAEAIRTKRLGCLCERKLPTPSYLTLRETNARMLVIDAAARPSMDYVRAISVQSMSTVDGIMDHSWARLVIAQAVSDGPIISVENTRGSKRADIRRFSDRDPLFIDEQNYSRSFARNSNKHLRPQWHPLVDLDSVVWVSEIGDDMLRYLSTSPVPMSYSTTWPQ
jgi:hypothetical protein